MPDRLEPDGAPNRFGIPTSSNQSNIHYHLGLAHYLRAEYEQALEAYRRCLTFASTHDMRVATVYWTVLTLQRLERAEEAEDLLASIHAQIPVLENTAYLDLLLHFKGERTAAQVLEGLEPGTVQHSTRSYGIACRFLWRGEERAGREALAQVLAGGFWAAFGHIAAEADLARG